MMSLRILQACNQLHKHTETYFHEKSFHEKDQTLNKVFQINESRNL